MNSLESWRNETAPATLRNRVLQSKMRSRVPAARLAISAAVVVGIAAFFISTSKPASAAALYKRMYGALSNIDNVHWVIYGGKEGIDATPAEWTHNWWAKGWMRRDGMKGRRFLKGPEQTWGFDPETGTVHKYDRPGQFLPHPEASVRSLVSSAPEEVTRLGSVMWNRRAFDVVETSVEDGPNQRFKIWIDRESELPFYFENERTSPDRMTLQRIWIFYNDPAPAALFKPENLDKSADEIQAGLTRKNLVSPPRP